MQFLSCAGQDLPLCQKFLMNSWNVIGNSESIEMQAETYPSCMVPCSRVYALRTECKLPVLQGGLSEGEQEHYIHPASVFGEGCFHRGKRGKGSVSPTLTSSLEVLFRAASCSLETKNFPVVT